MIETQDGVNIDTVSMELTFGKNTLIQYDGGSIDVGGTTHKLNEFNEGDTIYYDPKSNRLMPHKCSGNIQLGVFHSPVYLCELNMEQSLLRVDEVSAPVLLAMQGKKVVCLGDSMTEGVGTTKTYSQYLKELCDFSQVTSYGLGGSCIAPKVDKEPLWEEGLLSFYERYEAMDGDADIVIVFGCVNDWVTGRELGTMGDSGTNTFYGAVAALCEGLREKYPYAEIYFFSSPQ